MKDKNSDPDDILSEAAGLIGKDFSVQSHEKPTGPEQLLKLLEEEIGRLLDHDPEKLMQILYLIDVDEEIVKQALMSDNQSERIRLIAEAALEREIINAEFRKKYSGK